MFRQIIWVILVVFALSTVIVAQDEAEPLEFIELTDSHEDFMVAIGTPVYRTPSASGEAWFYVGDDRFNIRQLGYKQSEFYEVEFEGTTSLGYILVDDLYTPEAAQAVLNSQQENDRASEQPMSTIDETESSCGIARANDITEGAQIIYLSGDSTTLCAMNSDGTAPRALLSLVPEPGIDASSVHTLDVSENGKSMFALIQHRTIDDDQSSTLVGFDGYTIDLVTGESFNLDDMLIEDKTFGEMIAFAGRNEPIHEIFYWQEITVSPLGANFAFVALRYEEFSDGFYGAHLCLANLDTSNATCNFRTDIHIESPAWSPEGSLLAYVAGRTAFTGGTANIYTSPDGGIGRKRITNAPTGRWYRTPIWSPDGTMLAFQISPNQNKQTTEVYVANVFGGAEQFLVSSSDLGLIEMQWLADNQHLIIHSLIPNVYYLLDTMNPELIPLTFNDNNIFNIAWSQDGAKLLYQEYVPDEQLSRIVVADSDGTNPVVLATGHVPRWSADGQHIYYNDRSRHIHRMNADGSDDEILTESIQTASILAVTADPAEPLAYSPPECTVTGNGARIRNQPTTSSELIGELDANEQLVDGKTTDTAGFTWWRLATGGWVRSDVVTEAPFCINQPDVDAAAAVEVPDSEQASDNDESSNVDATSVVTASSNANIRQDASTNSAVVASASAGEQLIVISEVPDGQAINGISLWYEVEIEGGTGYIWSGAVN